jgi:hypothetical protein
MKNMELSKSLKIMGMSLAVLLLLATLNSMNFFFGFLKVTFNEWLVFNACAPSSITYLAGFLIFLITKNKTGLVVAALPIIFFGTMGLFIFPWSGMNIIAQISHLLMTLNIAWAFWIVLKFKDYKAMAIGLLISIILFVPYISYQQYYCRIHPEDLQRILNIH